MPLYLYRDPFFYVLYNSIINWDFNHSPATEVGFASLQFPGSAFCLFSPKAVTIATLWFVDSYSFEKRELIAAVLLPQGLMWVLSLALMARSPLTLDVQVLLLCLPAPQAVMSSPLLYTDCLWEVQRFGHQGCWRIVCEAWKTLNISRSNSSYAILKEQGSSDSSSYIKDILMAGLSNCR